MTTSAYLALASMEEIFTTTDLLAAGLRSVLNIGRHAVTYIPHDQIVTLDHPLTAHVEKQPANDNEPSAPEQEPKPATAYSPEKLALLAFMQRLTAHDMPFIWTRQAKDWLAYRNERNADQTGLRLFEQFTKTRPDLIGRINPAIINLLKPRIGRANLKVSHSLAPAGPVPAPETISIANRPFIEKLLSDKPSPKRAKKPDFDFAA